MDAYAAKALARNLLSHVGVRAYRRPDALVKLLQMRAIDVVLDVGANAGQFGRRIRAMGYRRKIVSFEPLSRAFQKLTSNARTFPEWTVVKLALGDVEQKREINVAGNSQSSSFLDMLPQHVSAAPKSAYVGKESVEVCTLDSVYGRYCQPQDRVFLKIDVQGFEEAVLRGGAQSLPKCAGVQLELSVVPLYDGSAMLCEMMKRMSDLGFSLMDIYPSFADPGSGKLLQVDGTFFQNCA